MTPAEPISRRHAIRLGLSTLAVPGLARAGEDDSLTFSLKEDAGLRRFGYPVLAVLPRIPRGPHYRLTRDGREVPAQFDRVTLEGGHPGLSVAFNASPGPLETESYVIQSVAEPPPPPRGGIRVEVGPEQVTVANGSVLSYRVPADLLGFLKGVDNAGLGFLRPDSPGLFLRYRDDIHYRVGGKGPNGVSTRLEVVRKGPMSATLRFESLEALRGERTVRSSVEMTFPNSKSWVETTWEVEDPEGYVAGLGVDLHLLLEGGPTLVDLGASSTVYSPLRPGEEIELAEGSASGLRRPGEGWTVKKGKPGELLFFAKNASLDSPPAEGWAHVMDATRCTALAVSGFAGGTRDRIIADASGRVRIWRDFAAQGGMPNGEKKTMTFWFHFVTMPVQVGAATSPQAMLAPLRVGWL